jgi:hypothetical protein
MRTDSLIAEGVELLERRVTTGYRPRYIFHKGTAPREASYTYIKTHIPAKKLKGAEKEDPAVLAWTHADRVDREADRGQPDAKRVQYHEKKLKDALKKLPKDEQSKFFDALGQRNAERKHP